MRLMPDRVRGPKAVSPLTTQRLTVGNACFFVMPLQDPMFSECVAFPITKGDTVVGSREDSNVRLGGEDILPRHAVITLQQELGQLQDIAFHHGELYPRGGRCIEVRCMG